MNELQKDVCVQCSKRRGVFWVGADEDRWNDGRVFCAALWELGAKRNNKIEVLWSRAAGVPACCYYPVEHIVLGQSA